ncbi:hypothetical protein K2173_000476 [Erythroxylum novogranatense]|uniref:Uncharacterized protein n=1 Tax=Erythroxylum novogranatense TaxID=1862640 RepID=A0AAV8SWE8_9ROSI|nr:hypothetical protein K2173_000476 [Erythroxylum novogranatense]
MRAFRVEDLPIKVSVSGVVDDGFVMPKLPGDEPDFWEGPQWDALGFFVQYLWAFGIIFAVCVLFASYDFFGRTRRSNSDVFESNPTEVAPSLE